MANELRSKLVKLMNEHGLGPMLKELLDVTDEAVNDLRDRGQTARAEKLLSVAEHLDDAEYAWRRFAR